MRKVLAVVNLIATIATIGWNYYTTIYGVKGNDVGKVSDSFENLFTPAGYAFSIWGIIFIGLMITAVMLCYLAFQKPDKGIISTITPELIAANLFNCAWVYVWLSLWTGASTIVMVGILISLIVCAIGIEQTKLGQSRILNWTIGVPIRIYLGWIMVATIANFSAYLNTLELTIFDNEALWFYVMISIGTIIIAGTLFRKGWYELPAVGIWAYTAIVVRHMESSPNLSNFVIANIVVLVLVMARRLLIDKKLRVSAD